MRKFIGSVAIGALATTAASAAVVQTTQHDAASIGLAGQLAVGDLISGLIATELPGDTGWHPANPAATNGSLDPAGLPTFTNDVNDTGLNGLLNDFPTLGTPTKSIQYDLAGPSDIAEIQWLTGNDGGDGRIFSTAVVRYSTDGGSNFSQLGYFESDAPGTVNAGTWRSTLVNVSDDAGALLTGVTNLQFDFYAVDNTGGQYRDPFDGVNPFNGVDDGLSAAFVAPLLWEIDVIAVPEPATLGLLALGGLALVRRR